MALLQNQCKPLQLGKLINLNIAIEIQSSRSRFRVLGWALPIYHGTISGIETHRQKSWNFHFWSGTSGNKRDYPQTNFIFNIESNYWNILLYFLFWDSNVLP